MAIPSLPAANFSALDTYYAGYRPYYGDQHVHSDCGGTSDGKFPLADWPAAMDEKQLDFAASTVVTSGCHAPVLSFCQALNCV